MKKIAKIISIIFAVLLISGLLFVANGFLGNPVSKFIVTNSAKEYVQETYPDTDYYVDRVDYSFKISKYYAHIKSPSSKDTYFSVSFDFFGNLGYDNYSSYVKDRFNTWSRINDEYREVTDKIFEKLPYEIYIGYGSIETTDKNNNSLDFGMDMSSLELDKVYDVNELGRKYGKITIYIYSDEVSDEKANEILLEIKNQFDTANQSFYAIDFNLRHPKNEDLKDWQDKEQIDMQDVLYSDIE